MIKSITLSNFFSFAEQQTVELDPYVNILIGINGSGKSNFIKAIELLSRGIEDGGAQEVIDEWWGLAHIKNYTFNNDKTPVELDYLFRIDSGFEQYNGIQQPEFLYSLTLGDDIARELFKIQKKEKVHKFYDNQKLENNKLLFSNTLTFQDKVIEKIKGKIEEIIVYKEINISTIRKKTVVYHKDDNRLSPSIENLASLLYYLNVHYPEYEKILDLLKSVNPYFDHISFISRGTNELEITMDEEGLPLEVVIQNISTGTLKFLALLAILYNPNRGKVVCLEEPEQGLHPDMIRTIAKGIKHAARTGTQMIVATHSPILLDSFLVDDMLVFEKDENNETRVTRKTEDDYENWVNDYSTGQLWMTGKMGGTRW